MTSHEYRMRAEKLLNSRTIMGARPEGAVEEAAVWANLALVAALTEANEKDAE